MREENRAHKNLFSGGSLLLCWTLKERMNIISSWEEEEKRK